MYPILKANKEDAADIVQLLNITYRSKESFNGWTTEADIIKGPIRTDEGIISDLMGQENSFILKCLDRDDKLIGCVHLKKDVHKMYLGMLSVMPGLQGKGIGKKLLYESEIWAKKQGCSAIYMQVISARTELNEWYMRHGYKMTGEKKDFDVNERYGVPVMPLEFVYLEKKIE